MAVKAQVFLNLHFILAAAWRRRYVIVLPILILPIVALLVGLSAPKRYQSHTTVLIQETAKLNPFLTDFSVSTQLKERMAALSALLHSRHMLIEVAIELGLINNAEDRRTTGEINRLSSSLSVMLIGSDMIKLTYRNDDPSNMSEVLEVVSTHFLGNLLAPERSSLTASETFLEDQLKLQKTSLMSSEKNLALFKSVNSANLPDQYNFDVKQLRDSETKLREKQTELAGAKAQIKSLRTQLLKTNPMLAAVEESIVRKTSELTLLKTRYTERHSSVMAAHRELARLETERESLLKTTNELTDEDFETLWQLASNIPVANGNNTIKPLLVSQMEAIEQAKSKEQQLQEEINQLTQVMVDITRKLESFASIEQQLTELERDIMTKQSLYNDFLKRFELAKVTGALGRYEEGDRVKVIDQPFNPHFPINPPTIIYLVAGIMGGIMLGCGLSILFELSNTTVIRRDTVESLVGFPVITRIPKISADALATQPNPTLFKQLT